MKIHDATLTISESLVTYPGDPATKITRVCVLGKGSESNLTKISMSAHTGTHVDAPVHFIEAAVAAEALDLNVLVGPAVVIDATKEISISSGSLEALNIPEGAERILFRTRNSEFWQSDSHIFSTDFVAITEDGAKWLVDKKIKLVGIDYLSIAPFHKAAPTHEILLRAGIIPIEGLNLSTIDPGLYFLVCLPLKIKGSDGSPARVILMEESG